MRVIWERNLDQLPGHLVLGASGLLVPERRTKLTRVDPTTGAAIWTVDVSTSWGWTAVAGDAALYLEQHSLLRCFDLNSGEPRWAIELADVLGRGGIWGDPMAGLDGQLILSGWRGYTPLAAISTRDGTALWAHDARDSGQARPVLRGDGIYVPRPDRGRIDVFAYDDGALRRSLPLSPFAHSAGESVVASYANGLFRCAGSSLLGFDPVRDETWHTVACISGSLRSRLPTRVGDRLLVRDDQQRVHAVWSDGTLAWTATASGHPQSLDVLACESESGDVLVDNFGFVQVVRDGVAIDARSVSRRTTTPPVPLGSRSVLLGGKGSLLAIDLGAQPSIAAPPW